MFKDYLNCIMTQGFKGFCDENKSYWLFSDVVSVLMCDKKFKTEDFIILKVIVKEEKADLKLYRDLSKDDEEFNKQNLLYSQKYEYTDLKEGTYKFYACRNELNTYTLMLCEEY